MFIYIKGVPRQGKDDMICRRVSDIYQILPVCKDTAKEEYRFSIVFDDATAMLSQVYKSREEAEMHQLAAVSMINALELLEYRRRVGDNSTVYYQFVTTDTSDGKAKLMTLPINEKFPVFTLNI